MKNRESQPENIQYPEIAAEIQRMADVDQNMREKNLKDSTHWSDDVDERNTERMRKIIAEIGWPTISRVGAEASGNAWLLVQHADQSPSFQRQCLDLMKREPEGEVSRHDIAYLEDRVLLTEGDFQLYGTQFEEKEGEFVPRPIRDAETVDERRKEMGLDTLKENIARMQAKYGGKSEDQIERM